MKYFENYNDACQNCDIITKKTDMFSQETIVKAEPIRFKCGYDYYTYLHPDSFSEDKLTLPEDDNGIILFDLQYKSSPQGEEFSIRSIDWGRNPNALIINIDTKENIRLERNYSYEGNFFSINKHDFLKCCEAKTIYFQLRNRDNILYEDTSSRNDMILYFQALYNEVVDDTKYQDAKETLMIKCQKGLDAYKQWKEPCKAGKKGWKWFG